MKLGSVYHLLDNNENKQDTRDTEFYVETLAGENHGTHEGVSL